MVKKDEERKPGTSLFFLALACSGCLQTPQLDALRRDLEMDPRERVRVYDSCRARSSTPEDLDTCMQSEGFRFIGAAAQDYRASECWSDRYAGTIPKAYCYDRTKTTP
jgi:hypothetical protein